MSDLSAFELLDAAARVRESAPRGVGCWTQEINWPAGFGSDATTLVARVFELEKCSYFVEAHAEVKEDIQTRCSIDVLSEAFFIEESGMAFASKMALMSETRQERMLYNLFAVDVATHFHWASQCRTGRACVTDDTQSISPSP